MNKEFSFDVELVNRMNQEILSGNSSYDGLMFKKNMKDGALSFIAWNMNDGWFPHNGDLSADYPDTLFCHIIRDNFTLEAVNKEFDELEKLIKDLNRKYTEDAPDGRKRAYIVCMMAPTDLETIVTTAYCPSEERMLLCRDVKSYIDAPMILCDGKWTTDHHYQIVFENELEKRKDFFLDRNSYENAFWGEPWHKRPELHVDPTYKKRLRGPEIKEAYEEKLKEEGIKYDPQEVDPLEVFMQGLNGVNRKRTVKKEENISDQTKKLENRVERCIRLLSMNAPDILIASELVLIRRALDERGAVDRLLGAIFDGATKEDYEC